jgi:hypothetical protein
LTFESGLPNFQEMYPVIMESRGIKSRIRENTKSSLRIMKSDFLYLYLFDRIYKITTKGTVTREETRE